MCGKECRGAYERSRVFLLSRGLVKLPRLCNSLETTSLSQSFPATSNALAPSLQTARTLSFCAAHQAIRQLLSHLTEVPTTHPVSSETRYIMARASIRRTVPFSVIAMTLVLLVPVKGSSEGVTEGANGLLRMTLSHHKQYPFGNASQASTSAAYEQSQSAWLPSLVLYTRMHCRFWCMQTCSAAFAQSFACKQPNPMRRSPSSRPSLDGS